jgi:hypothetical protein
VTPIALDDLGTSTPLESHKSLLRNASYGVSSHFSSCGSMNDQGDLPSHPISDGSPQPHQIDRDQIKSGSTICL